MQRSEFREDAASSAGDGPLGGEGRRRRTAARRLFVLLSAGVVISTAGLLAYRLSSKQAHAPEAEPVVAPPAEEPVIDYEQLRAEAWERIRPRLGEADACTRELGTRLVGRLDSFFESRKRGADDFAEAALGLQSKWELVKSRTGHREFIRKQFCTFVFSEGELAALLRAATTEYEHGLKRIENELLVKVRADLADLPEGTIPALASEELLSRQFDRMAADVAGEVRQDLAVDVGGGVTSFVAGEGIAVVTAKALAAVAGRLGISAAALGGGAASSWATFGVGIVIGVVVDYLVDCVVGWFYDPVGEVSAKVVQSLDNVGELITEGDPEAWAARERLLQMAESDPDPRVRARAGEVADSIERGGALGLRHAVAGLTEARDQTRELALHRLVFGEER